MDTMTNEARNLCPVDFQWSGQLATEDKNLAVVHTRRQIVERDIGRIPNFKLMKRLCTKRVLRYSLKLLRKAFLVTFKLVNLKNTYAASLD